MTKMVALMLHRMTDYQLDYAAAVSQGWELVGGNWVKGGSVMCGPASEYRPSKDWRQLGLLIEYIHERYAPFIARTDRMLVECISILVGNYHTAIMVPDDNDKEKQND